MYMVYNHVMFIRVTTNRKGQAYYHLVESYRDQGKVRQRILLSLGKVGEESKIRDWVKKRRTQT